MTGTCSNSPCERLVYAKDECRSCYGYRWEHHEARPEVLILKLASRRARNRGWRMPKGASQVERLHRILANQSGDVSPQAVPLCAPCGTVKAWTAGEPIPLCARHRGFAVILALMVDDDVKAQDGLMELLTA